MSTPVARTPKQERKYQDHVRWLAKPGNREKHRATCRAANAKRRADPTYQKYQEDYRARTGSL